MSMMTELRLFGRRHSMSSLIDWQHGVSVSTGPSPVSRVVINPR